MSATSTSDPNASPAPAAGHARRRPDNWRETVESVVVAFVLAFLIRAFEAEAFVIPTGSMAPTLMGRHKDVTCEQCGYRFPVGTGERDSDHDGLHAVCPVCRYSNLTSRSSFNGDRILVLKFPYAFSAPQRWDVSVFHYPEEAAQNYIKRVGGVGPEELRIYGGDLYRRDPGDSAWQIVRKPEEKQRVLQMLVHDNNFLPKALGAAARQRWVPDEGWTSRQDGRAFTVEPSDQSAWLRYRNIVPDFGDWDNPPANGPRPRLITDFYAYNATERTQGHSPTGTHWVGDLTVGFDVDVREATGQLICELNEGIGSYQCRFDLTTGQVELTQRIWGGGQDRPLIERTLAQADTPLKDTGKYRVSFANVDDRLMLWVDDVPVRFHEGVDGVEYHPPHWESAVQRALADAPQAFRVSVLHPSFDASEKQPFASSLKRLAEFIERTTGRRPTEFPYQPGDRLVHLLDRNRDAPVILLGTAVQQTAFLATHLDVLDRDNAKIYAVGADVSLARRELVWDHARHLTIVHPAPTDRDLKPVAITAQGARLEISRLRIDRDVYYVAASQFSSGERDYDVSFTQPEFFADPSGWQQAFDNLRDAVFQLEEGQFLMLGDNSPRSKDSRLWTTGPEVVEDLLIGRAFYIYWPHGKPLLGIPKLPFWPHFRRMTFIR